MRTSAGISFVLSALALSSIGCGAPSDSFDSGSDIEARSSGVIGGRAETGYPAVGFLQWGIVGQSGTSSEDCVGTLIAPNAFITAEHCVRDAGVKTSIGVNKYGIGFGSMDANHFNPKIYWAKKFISPSYSSSGELFGDYAIGILEECVSGIEPVTIGSIGDSLAGDDELGRVHTGSEHYRFIGYGGQQEGPYESGGGNAGQRKSAAMSIYHADNTFLLARGIDGGLCRGDSGGALMIEGTNIILGVLSGGAPGNPDPCEVGNKSSFATLDSPERRAFIDAAVADARKMRCAETQSWDSLVSGSGIGDCHIGQHVFGLECNQAFSTFCQNEGWGTTGFGPLEKSKTLVDFMCTSAKVEDTSYAELSSPQYQVPRCDGHDARSSNGPECASAIHRVCVHRYGQASGFGPIDNDPLRIACVSPESADVFVDRFTYADLEARHSQCDGKNEDWGPSCNAAIDRLCKENGYATGYGPVERSGNPDDPSHHALTLVCMKH